MAGEESVMRYRFGPTHSFSRMRTRSFTSATGLLPSRWPRCGPCYVGSDCTIAAAGKRKCRQVERKRTTSAPEAPMQGKYKMQHAKTRRRGWHLAQHAKRRRSKHVPVAYPLPARGRRAMRFTAPNPPLPARGAAEGPATRLPASRWRAWPPNRPPWPGHPQAW